MNREQIVSEIKRTAKANRGVPLGRAQFEKETGIGRYDWYGRFWARWGDAVREAGFKANRLTEASTDSLYKDG